MDSAFLSIKTLHIRLVGIFHRHNALTRLHVRSWPRVLTSRRLACFIIISDLPVTARFLTVAELSAFPLQPGFFINESDQRTAHVSARCSSGLEA